jgi:hypothetical protein
MKATDVQLVGEMLGSPGSGRTPLPGVFSLSVSSGAACGPAGLGKGRALSRPVSESCFAGSGCFGSAIGVLARASACRSVIMGYAHLALRLRPKHGIFDRWSAIPVTECRARARHVQDGRDPAATTLAHRNGRCSNSCSTFNDPATILLVALISGVLLDVACRPWLSKFWRPGRLSSRWIFGSERGPLSLHCSAAREQIKHCRFPFANARQRHPA